jgi:hypothetical protein
LFLTPEQSGTLLIDPCTSYGGFKMYIFAKRLLAAETQADKEEFVRGVAGLDKNAGRNKVLAGIIAGNLLAVAARRNKR